MDKTNRSEHIRHDTDFTKRMSYLSMNPLLTSPRVYQNSNIEEYKRIQYTRAREMGDGVESHGRKDSAHVEKMFRQKHVSY